MNKIYNDDCINFDIEKCLNGRLLDAIITDPPYNISKENRLHTLGRKGVDFGEWDKNFNPKDWIIKYAPFVKNGGSVIVFCAWRQISEIIAIFEEIDFEFKDTIRWIKTNPMPRNTERRYVLDIEVALWLVKKGAKWTFNKQNEISYLRPEFTTPKLSGLERTEHPTQKPLSLISQILQIHTNENDIVLDPFVGSGTTAISCLRNNRNFIAIEKDKKYFQIAKNRIEQEFCENLFLGIKAL